MSLSLEHPCAACGARIAVRGARAFTPLPCPQCGASFRARVEIGGFHLGEILVRSGLGVIFRAKDQGGTDVAVKVLQPPFAAEAVDVEYFVSEVWALARLNHPHGLRIFATGVDHGLAWIAMEWLPLGSLAARIATRGALREAEVLAIGLQAAGALGAAYDAGHAHRDVAAENLVFADARTVKVTDFGQAALYQIAANDLGTMWGRACFVPPERMRGEPEEAHSDIYMLGATLFHALVGTPPRGAEPNPLAVLEMLESREMRIEEFVPGLHEKTAQVLNKMLAAEPLDRFQHWSEVTAQLGQAGMLVARRDAAGGVAVVAPARPAAADASRRARGAGRGRPVALVWILGVLGFIGVVAALAVFLVRTRQPLPPVAGTPAPLVAPAPKVPTPPPASKPAAPAFDWAGWQTGELVGVTRGPKPVAEGDAAGRLRFSGAGQGIRVTGEDAPFHSRTIDGDWTLTARLAARDAAAGLSVRDPAVGKVALSVWVAPDAIVTTATRRLAGAKPEIATPAAPAKTGWLRLTRRGSTLLAEASTDGRQWQRVAVVENAAVPAAVSLGFVVWSGVKDRVADAVFEQIALERQP